MKDPAFLFYSKDFYEGTRMMLPEERACYVDLLIYQHQNGPIPLDLRRVMMYCSGCTIETIQHVLDQKFDKTVNGWLNKRLTIESENRSTNKPKKIASASFAGLISSNNLSKKQIDFLKKNFNINDFIVEKDILIIDESIIKSKVKEWFNNMLNQMVKNLANVNAIANAIEDVNSIKNENEVFDLNIQNSKKTEIENEIEILVEVYQNVTGRKFKAIHTIIKNYTHWRKTYAPDEIEQAIRNIPKDKFWCDKMTPIMLLRLRNPRGENVDFIGGLLEYSKSANEKQKANAMSATAQYLESLK